jgi:hypothetical protein
MAPSNPCGQRHQLLLKLAIFYSPFNLYIVIVGCNVWKPERKVFHQAWEVSVWVEGKTFYKGSLQIESGYQPAKQLKETDNTEQWVEIATVRPAIFSENKYQQSVKRMQGNNQHERHWLLTEGELWEFQTEI